MTKVWGFDEPCGPLQFSTKGWRDRAREELKEGDLVVLVGTKGEETAFERQGRLLGIMEPTREIVSSLDFNLRTRPIDFDDGGNYRWPYGLLNRRAWKIVEPRPLLEEITTEEAAKVLQLPRQPIALLETVRTLLRTEGEEVAWRRSAPAPTTVRRGIMHLRRAAAYTYAMSIEGASQECFKIGWAFDYKARQRQFNLAALPELGGLRYKPRLFCPWDTARDAYRMEQAVLRHFDINRHPANREVVHGISYGLLERTWIAYLQGAMRAAG